MNEDLRERLARLLDDGERAFWFDGELIALALADAVLQEIEAAGYVLVPEEYLCELMDGYGHEMISPRDGLEREMRAFVDAWLSRL
jgi:hypothetical protein